VDERYDSAYGLREDLLECKKRLAALNPEEVKSNFKNLCSSKF
jgi:hypothetical protein